MFGEGERNVSGSDLWDRFGGDMSAAVASLLRLRESFLLYVMRVFILAVVVRKVEVVVGELKSCPDMDPSVSVRLCDCALLEVSCSWKTR